MTCISWVLTGCPLLIKHINYREDRFYLCSPREVWGFVVGESSLIPPALGEGCRAKAHYTPLISDGFLIPIPGQQQQKAYPWGLIQVEPSLQVLHPSGAVGLGCKGEKSVCWLFQSSSSSYLGKGCALQAKPDCCSSSKRYLSKKSVLSRPNLDAALLLQIGIYKDFIQFLETHTKEKEA